MIIQRTFKPRGWEVFGKPAISISVSSSLFYRQDLITLYSSEPGIRLENLFVKDKHSNLKGEIVAVAGQVRDHRARLLALSSSEISRRTIAAANDADLVMRVRTRNRRVYDYVIGALDIVVRTMDFERFNVDGRKALNLMKLAPQKRWKIVKDLAKLVQAEGLIGGELTEETLELRFTRSIMRTNAGFCSVMEVLKTITKRQFFPIFAVTRCSILQISTAQTNRSKLE